MRFFGKHFLRRKNPGVSCGDYSYFIAGALIIPGGNLLMHLLKRASFNISLKTFFKIIVFKFVSICFYFSFMFENLSFYCVSSMNRTDIFCCCLLIWKEVVGKISLNIVVLCVKFSLLSQMPLVFGKKKKLVFLRRSEKCKLFHRLFFDQNLSIFIFAPFGNVSLINHKKGSCALWVENKIKICRWVLTFRIFFLHNLVYLDKVKEWILDLFWGFISIKTNWAGFYVVVAVGCFLGFGSFPHR